MSTEETPSVRTLLPALSTKSALERKYIQFILKSDPGIGDKSIEIASSLADSGFSPAAAAMILRSLYGNVLAPGRGRANRVRWFTEAIVSRYGHRLDKIKNDYMSFRAFLAEMEEVSDLRDQLDAAGYKFSFHGAFLIWEIGEDADSVVAMINDHTGELPQFKPHVAGMVVRAAISVQAGKHTMLETAFAEMCYPWRGQ